MLLYDAIHKTYKDFTNVYPYRMDGESGVLIETDRKLEKGQVIIIKDIKEYAIIVDSTWEENGQTYFSNKTAQDLIVRARIPGKLRSY